MNTALGIALMGGFLGILTLIHFVVDWIFQTHAEAMVKHNNPKIRAKHCLIYTIGFIPFMWALHFSLLEMAVGLNILFWSHFCEDTYIPVYLWAKYIRKPPEMTALTVCVVPAQSGNLNPSDALKGAKMVADPKAGFVQFVGTPLGKILMIVIDQIIHLLFLLPIAWMALQHISKVSLFLN